MGGGGSPAGGREGNGRPRGGCPPGGELVFLWGARRRGRQSRELAARECKRVERGGQHPPDGGLSRTTATGTAGTTAAPAGTPHTHTHRPLLPSTGAGPLLPGKGRPPLSLAPLPLGLHGCSATAPGLARSSPLSSQQVRLSPSSSPHRRLRPSLTLPFPLGRPVLPPPPRYLAHFPGCCRRCHCHLCPRISSFCGDQVADRCLAEGMGGGRSCASCRRRGRWARPFGSSSVPRGLSPPHPSPPRSPPPQLYRPQQDVAGAALCGGPQMGGGGR